MATKIEHASVFAANPQTPDSGDRIALRGGGIGDLLDPAATWCQGRGIESVVGGLRYFTGESNWSAPTQTDPGIYIGFFDSFYIAMRANFGLFYKQMTSSKPEQKSNVAMGMVVTDPRESS
jgi:hypothetical protein